MSKELDELLETIDSMIETCAIYELHKCPKVNIEISKKELLSIQRELQRLKLIENANASEELECLDRMLGYASLDENDFEKVSDDYNTIKQALQRLETIENAKPSEALECLKTIANSFVIAYDNNILSYNYIHEISTIKKALIQTEHDKGKIKILKEKNKDLLSAIQNLERAYTEATSKQACFDYLKTNVIRQIFEYKGRYFISINEDSPWISTTEINKEAYEELKKLGVKNE